MGGGGGGGSKHNKPEVNLTEYSVNLFLMLDDFIINQCSNDNNTLFSQMHVCNKS